MADSNENIDNLLLLITQRSGGVEKLLENFFSFLARKTDFYRPPDKDDSISLDHCANLVSYYCRNIGMKYADLIAKNSKKVAATQQADQKSGTAEDSTPSSPQSPNKKTDSSSETGTPFHFSKSDKLDKKSQTKSKETHSNPTTARSSSDKNPSTGTNTGSTTENTTDNDDEDDDSPPPPGNGGKTQWYEWTQTLSSLEVLVKVPPGTLTKHVKVDIGTNKLNVKINNELLFGGELFDTVKSDESVWALVDNKLLQITLEKRNQMNWWATVVKGHPEIDVKKIVPENSKLSDLDPETRSTVEKMMFDQRQKAAGLPTSSQRSQYEALEKFKKAHPELDFSNAQINFS